MRVSARRMRAAWRVFGDGFEREAVRRYRGELRDDRCPARAGPRPRRPDRARRGPRRAARRPPAGRPRVARRRVAGRARGAGRRPRPPARVERGSAPSSVTTGCSSRRPATRRGRSRRTRRRSSGRGCRPGSGPPTRTCGRSTARSRPRTWRRSTSCGSPPSGCATRWSSCADRWIPEATALIRPVVALQDHLGDQHDQHVAAQRAREWAGTHDHGRRGGALDRQARHGARRGRRAAGREPRRGLAAARRTRLPAPPRPRDREAVTMTAASPAVQRGWVEKWVPGIAAMRTYQRAWLSRDLIAGIVLVTLLVPQGMAYAELAGLPAITGLYTTVVCLVAFSLVGSSPVLILGPDSALGPMIAATILPLAGGERRAEDRARRDARAARRGDHGRGGHRAARVRRGPALEPGPDRVPRRSRDHDPHRAAAQAVRVQHGRERPRQRGGRVRPGPRRDEHLGARDRRDQPRDHHRPADRVATDAGHPRRGRRLARGVRGPGPRRARGGRDRRAAAGLPAAVDPERAARRHPGAVRRGRRDHAGRGRRHDLDLQRVRDPRRLRGGHEPGARRASGRPTSPPACSRASRSPPARRGRRSRSSRARSRS